MSAPSAGSPASLDHPVLAALTDAVAPVADDLATDGHRLYFVGGVVRDLLLDADGMFTDVDLTTDAHPERVRRAVAPIADALWTQGERFGTIGITVGATVFEITTHRDEAYDAQSRKPVVRFGTDLATDLSRRDFTINAMAVEVRHSVVVDPFGGRADLAARRLRTPLDAEVSFTDDPLRMLRAARFAPRFALEIDPAVEAAATALASRLEIVSAERIHDELERLLDLPDPGVGLDFLVRTGLLDEIGLAAVDGAALSARLTGLRSARMRRAGLLHDLGRADAGTWLTEMRYATADRRSTLAAMRSVELALDARRSASARLRRIARHVGADGVDELLDLVGRIEPDVVDELRVALGPLRAEPGFGERRAVLDGREVADLLGERPGPRIGEVLEVLDRHQLDHGPIGVDEARALVRDWSTGAPSTPRAEHR